MALTTQQLQTLKADIAADPALNALPNNSDGAFAISSAYAQTAVPNYTVWKTSVIVSELMGTGFDWTRVDNLTVGKSRIWEFMTAVAILNTAEPNVRAGFLAVFATAADLATRQAIFNHSQRLANRAEKLYATGAGTTSNDQGIGPATMTVEGVLSIDDIITARNLP